MKRRLRNEHRDYPYRPPRQEEDAEGRPPSSSWGLYARFFRTYLLPHWGKILFCILLVSLNTCSVYLIAYYGRTVVDRILVITPESREETAPAGRRGLIGRDRAPAPRSPPGRGRVSEKARDEQADARPAGAMHSLMWLFGIYVGTLVVLNYSDRLSQRLRIRISQELTGRLRNDMHHKILTLSQAYHQMHSPGRLMARILSDVDVVQRQMLQTIVDASSFTLMFLVGIVILLVLDWRIAAWVFIAMVPYSFAIQSVRTRVRHVSRELRHTNACLFGFVTQKLDAIRAIFAYGRERSEGLNFHRLAATFFRDSIEQQRLGAGVSRSAQIITSTTTVGIFLYCAGRVVDGDMTLGKMMYIHGAAANLFTPVLQLTQMALVISNLLVVLNRLTHVFDQPLDIAESPNAVEFPGRLVSGIELRHVTFRYAEDQEPVLRDISLHIPAGRWICIMGPSGSGKSTLLHQLARLRDPSEGTILMDGIRLDALTFASLRRHVSLVPQEAQIFSGTVRSNITYGYPTASPNEIMAAARAAECHDFIMELPVKYETTIGERGSTLSGGQRQRISIARALLSDPDVLLLDDCTSALDAETEQRIQATLARLMTGKTAVIVSQRVSMARRCHRIVVVEDGAITEKGTHEQLVANNGFYARLHARQTE